MNVRVDKAGHKRAALKVYYSGTRSAILQYALEVSDRDDRAFANRHGLDHRLRVIDSEYRAAQENGCTRLEAAVSVVVRGRRLHAFHKIDQRRENRSVFVRSPMKLFSIEPLSSRVTTAGQCEPDPRPDPTEDQRSRQRGSIESTELRSFQDSQGQESPTAKHITRVHLTSIS